MRMTFYLGTHLPHWLQKTDVPLFISHRRLSSRGSCAPSLGRWALDSGGFTELSMYGEWRVPAKEYATAVQRYQAEIGNLDWAAIQDWMCEPIIREKTKLSVFEHQTRTIDSWIELNMLAPDVPWTPVLQGWEMADYWHHFDMYEKRAPGWRTGVVGVGSVCRRQETDLASYLIRDLWMQKVRVHAFGYRRPGLAKIAYFLHSSDSLAWSFCARKDNIAATETCRLTHASCANCLDYAVKWYKKTCEIICASEAKAQARVDAAKARKAMVQPAP